MERDLAITQILNSISQLKKSIGKKEFTENFIIEKAFSFFRSLSNWPQLSQIFKAIPEQVTSCKAV